MSNNISLTDVSPEHQNEIDDLKIENLTEDDLNRKTV
jgi:hypothetical protein